MSMNTYLWKRKKKTATALRSKSASAITTLFGKGKRASLKVPVRSPIKYTIPWSLEKEKKNVMVHKKKKESNLRAYAVKTSVLLTLYCKVPASDNL